jgi:hypothetical protein
MLMTVNTFKKFQEKQFEADGTLESITINDVTLTKEQIITMADNLHGNHNITELEIPVKLTTPPL